MSRNSNLTQKGRPVGPQWHQKTSSNNRKAKTHPSGICSEQKATPRAFALAHHLGHQPEKNSRVNSFLGAMGQNFDTFRGHENMITCVAVVWAQRKAVTGSGDKSVKLWDLERAVCLETLHGHSGTVTCVDMDISAPMGVDCCAPKWVLSGSVDRTLKLWDLEIASCVETMKGHRGAVTCISVDWAARHQTC